MYHISKTNRDISKIILVLFFFMLKDSEKNMIIQFNFTIRILAAGS